MDTVRANAGIWLRRDHTVLQLSGKDALTWLHAQSTNTVTGIASGHGNYQALLDRQGRVQACFSAHRWDDELWIVIENEQVPAFLARVDSHVIVEEVHVANVGEGVPQICVEGPRAAVLLANLLGVEPDDAMAMLPKEPCSVAPPHVLGREVLAFAMTETREDGFLLVPDAESAGALYDELRDHAAGFQMEEVSEAARQTLRLESGLPRFGLDFDSGDIISTTPWEHLAVAYDKGCYLGQEVVARVKAYGSPKNALAYLFVAAPDAALPDTFAPIFVDGKRAGQFRRALFSTRLGGWLATAFLERDHRTPGTTITLTTENGQLTTMRVLAWPPYAPPSREAFAHSLYDAALERFHSDAADTDVSIIETLREAVLLAPGFEDAYEALGVILNRHHRVDEAIAVMKRLEAINPNSVMVHTNLSVFYVAKGMIPEAEAEKAKAKQLEFKHELDTRAAEKAAQAERARLEQEAIGRIAMFNEVLEIDPEDSVANMGLALAYIQLNQHAAAIPHLERAIQSQKDYSAAYLHLGKCHEVCGNDTAAQATYRDGIAAATRKGDLVPLQEMQRRLNALETAPQR
jgi:folate-binding protein YgfZ